MSEYPQPVGPIRVLFVEDDPSDALLVERELKLSGLTTIAHRVATEPDYLQAIDPTVDVILADFSMPGFGAVRALDLLKASGLDIPFIVVSGSIGEEMAVRILQSGASDYLLKDRLARLGQAVTRAIEERRVRLEKRAVAAELQQTEGRMRFALDASRVGVWEADLHTGNVVWSEILESLHGLEPGEFGGTFDAFLAQVHPDDRQHVRETVQQTSGTHDSNILYRCVWRDGSTHWISGRGRTFFDADGRPVRAAGIGLDVTERRALEEQYRQAQKMEAVGLLAGGVAHDFNNLLTAIQGYCALLAESIGENSAHQADLREIREAADRATSLTRQLLAFSRRQTLEPRVLDLQVSVDALAPMLRRLIGEDVEILIRGVSQGRVRADPGQVEQVILNLALNARDAMPTGGRLALDISDAVIDEAYVMRHPDATPGPYVTLSVTDNGIGMDASTAARVFEPFFTTKAQGRGTGLGLSTVYGIVKQSGGHISLQSELGTGTTFRVYLPRVDDPVDTIARPQMPAVVHGAETVLVAEDEAGVRRLVQRVLEQHGYRVLAVSTPHDAIEMARGFANPIHLLLSDVVLPHMSGRALAEHIRDIRTDIRVLYTSGYTDNTISQLGVLEPGTPFIQKPFTPDALVRKVREVLDAPEHVFSQF
jgi:two-component system, cell cycle sensor histidine kinase and response regulator CckA